MGGQRPRLLQRIDVSTCSARYIALSHPTPHPSLPPYPPPLAPSPRPISLILRSLCIIAGDISPVDVISHLPVLCEENEVPHVYVSSKADLGASAGTKRPTSVVLVAPKKGQDFEAERMKEAMDEVKELHA
jgi:hypothetical protein